MRGRWGEVVGRDDYHRRRRSAQTNFAVAKAMGADHMIDFTAGDVVEQIMELTEGRGVDVAIEALGTQGTFENALRVLRPGGTLSSLGVYSTDLRIPLNAFAAGLGDNKIVTTLCPGGKANACADSWRSSNRVGSI